MNIANKISTFRILSVPFFIACLMYSQQNVYFRFLALGIFILGVISDAVDGYIARKSGQNSKAGLILDPLGDKLLLMSAYICLHVIKELPLTFPLWVTLVVISRDTIIILGVVVIYMTKQKLDVIPSKWGKYSTAFQMLAVIAVLIPLAFSFFFWWLAVIFTIISGIDYLRKGFGILYALDNPRNNR